MLTILHGLADVNTDENITFVGMGKPSSPTVNANVRKAETCKVCGKGGKKSMRSMIQFKKYLPSAFSQLLNYCLEEFRGAKETEWNEIVLTSLPVDWNLL